MRPRSSTVCAYCITVNWRTCDSVTLIERQPRQAAMSEPPLVIDVVDNGGQWTHREWRMLRYLGVDTQIIENTTPVSDLRQLDGLILSGGAARVGLTGELGNCGAYLELDIPILGICAGHQFMAGYYGGAAAEAVEPEFGAAQITLANGGGQIFADTPDVQTVWESHNDEVSVVPEGFFITQAANLALFREWRMKKATDLDCNSTQRSMSQNTDKTCSRISLKSAKRTEIRSKQPSSLVDGFKWER